MRNKIYPRPGDTQIVYLQDVVNGPNIEVGAYTIYNDFVHDPRDFEKNNVLYHYPVNGDRLKIGKFCSVACGAKFLFTSGNHSLRSLSTYTFPRRLQFEFISVPPILDLMPLIRPSVRSMVYTILGMMSFRHFNKFALLSYMP